MQARQRIFLFTVGNSLQPIRFFPFATSFIRSTFAGEKNETLRYEDETLRYENETLRYEDETLRYEDETLRY